MRRTYSKINYTIVESRIEKNFIELRFSVLKLSLCTRSILKGERQSRIKPRNQVDLQTHTIRLSLEKYLYPSKTDLIDVNLYISNSSTLDDLRGDRNSSFHKYDTLILQACYPLDHLLAYFTFRDAH